MGATGAFPVSDWVSVIIEEGRPRVFRRADSLRLAGLAALEEYGGGRPPVYEEGHIWAVGMPDGQLWEGERVKRFGGGAVLAVIPGRAYDLLRGVRRVVDCGDCSSCHSRARAGAEVVRLGPVGSAAFLAIARALGVVVGCPGCGEDVGEAIVVCGGWVYA